MTPASMPPGPGTLQPTQDGPWRAIPLAGGTSDPHQPTVGIILSVLTDKQAPPPHQGRSHGGQIMKSGQRILGDWTWDPRLSCPNADNCTTASPAWILFRIASYSFFLHFPIPLVNNLLHLKNHPMHCLPLPLVLLPTQKIMMTFSLYLSHFLPFFAHPLSNLVKLQASYIFLSTASWSVIYISSSFFFFLFATFPYAFQQVSLSTQGPQEPQSDAPTHDTSLDQDPASLTLHRLSQVSSVLSQYVDHPQ